MKVQIPHFFSARAHRRIVKSEQYEDLADAPRLPEQLRDELVEKHPERNPTPQVVRKTLGSLVAKGRIRRHKQQRSVRYTLVQPGESDSSDRYLRARPADAGLGVRTRRRAELAK
ncbi:hypothetical protein EOT10_04905 [Streptomyces antnestii]|uniref:Uncharacterized protein n=1 Tax=Streptomyces antnestii TaxID=2494256 RepID=A0A3S2W4E2_9ACTN|nr:hypothetical protein [Streptomyces sp. San01]RVU27657.1 hypothetical protein EOT10_04905 [Streptomyces sp. San01]